MSNTKTNRARVTLTTAAILIASLVVGGVYYMPALAQSAEPSKAEPAKPVGESPKSDAKPESKPDSEKPTEPAKAAPARPVNYNDLLDQPIGDHVVETKDVKYVEGDDAHARHTLDLYMPKDKKDVPVVVFVHGGMWTMFDKRHGKAISRGISTAGYGVVSINYRLAAFTGDQARHPEFVEDAAAAVAWVHKNVAKYGGDPKKIFVSGHSAGGHIAGLVAYDPTYLAKHDLKNTEVVRGFIGLSGAYDIPNTDDADPIIKNLANLVTYAFDLDAEARKKASPSSHADAGDPPALLLYAEKEMFKLDLSTTSMDAKLSEANVARAKRMIAARDHRTILGEFGTEEDAANKETLAFIKNVLAGEFKGDPAVVVAKPEGDAPTVADAEAKPTSDNGATTDANPANGNGASSGTTPESKPDTDKTPADKTGASAPSNGAAK